jgi:SpoVK/Ycf46/Vps4 family AAA+-type ATPase
LPNTKGADDSRLRRFARKVEPKYGTEQLVLGPVTAAKFREALDFMRTKEFCEEEWGFKEKHSRGHGITVLFHGESGTGKTMAAEVIAHTLKRPLYQIDLSSVFSKWVGETEKNLRAVFEAASGVNGVLLFDEGDALFGARSSGGGSAQDRYGNLEVNFLLQELEAFNGISVISTNHFKNLDSAFLRRFSFSITFQQPTPELREKIWRANVPAKMPLAENVDFKHLSLFAMSGGSVRNCIREAAATAAAKKASEVTHEDFLRAIKRECQKFEREFPRELVGEVYWRKVSPEWELSPVKRLPRV